MKAIKTVGVIGAGTMGSALAQKFAQEGFNVILLDTKISFVEKGINRIKEILLEGVERKIFTTEKVDIILSKIKGSENKSDLKGTDLVIEAIYENFEAKSELFKSLNNVLNSETIIATNTSSYSVNELAKFISYPERFIGLHYFYHAAKNRLVEIIPGKKTSEETINSTNLFCTLSGKDAITCKDSYGFVVNRFFVPWLNEAVRIYEEGLATPSEIDAVCIKDFSISMGPYALMNATGIPVAYHAEKTLERFGELYKTSDTLKKQAELNENWVLENPELSDIIPEKKKIIRERMFGIVFTVCSQLLDENVCKAVDINRGARIGLRWRKGPVDIMIKLGESVVNTLIKQMSEIYHTIQPKSIGKNYWDMEFVVLNKKNNIATITMQRPEDMNALNETVIKQLSDKFEEAENDVNIDNIIITGSGKAFVAGADIKFFLDNIKSNTLNKIVEFTKYGQSVYDRIDKSKKKVVAIINGLTLGGGLELALCADIILATPKALFAFPETGIGIYPGLGGTQRSQKRIGKGLSKYLIYTGDMLNVFEAEQIGLIDGIIQFESINKLTEGALEIPNSIIGKVVLNQKYTTIHDFFDKNSLEQLLSSNIDTENIPKELIDKLVKKIKRKAPIALTISEKLINESRGCESELEELIHIFSTSDALLGLSKIGKPVEYQGK